MQARKRMIRQDDKGRAGGSGTKEKHGYQRIPQRDQKAIS